MDSTLRKSIRFLSYTVAVVLMGNLNALFDYYLHPDIPYFSQGHFIIGGIVSLLTIVICLFLESRIRKSQKSNLSTHHLGLYTGLLAAVWTMVILLSLSWNIMRQKQSTMEIALNEARTVFEKDLNFYRWATEREGVFVPITANTPTNPYLAHFPEYMITSEDGMQLTLVNPEYMIRQVYEMQTTKYGALGHITSLEPLGKENAADPWETEALKSFEQGVSEVRSMEKIKGEPYFRMMRPMVTEEGCLKCHAAQGYEVGDIRGGISVSIPMTPLFSINRNATFMLSLAHGSLWVLGIIGIFLGSFRTSAAIVEREQAEARTRSILDNMLDGLITLDEDGMIESLNAAATRIFGYESAEVLGREVDLLVTFPPEQNPEGAARKELHLNIRQAMGSQQEFLGYRKDGATFPLEMSLSEMRLGSKSVVIAMVRDITREKIRKAEALRAGQLAAIGELAAGVAHEINNPINGIINFTQILMDQAEAEENRNPESEDIMRRIIREGDRIAAIVRNLLDFARQRDDAMKEVQIQEVINDSISLLNYQFQKSGIRVLVKVEAGLPAIRGNPQQLQQVFLNLLSNSKYALDHRYPGKDQNKRVEISSQVVSVAGKEYLRTMVADWGGGIPAEIFPRIFDPLFSTKPSGQGTGLGLSISQNLIKEHRGELHFENVPGEQTIAMVDLPLA